ncbi:hypothetical protein C8Q74DRAFT_292353 [Fomes fomentarius]|nr:hypothetical protein C8Q74DRAFT_292353 [Fomes fomentarius]
MPESVKIEDNDSRVQYIGEWSTDPFAEASGGSRHGAAVLGVMATLSFTGTSIQVYGIIDDSPHDGQPTTRYDVDGETVETYTTPWTDTRAFDVRFFVKSDLSPGDHTIRITNMNGTSPTIFWLDYFVVDASFSQPQPPLSSSSGSPKTTSLSSVASSTQLTLHSFTPSTTTTTSTSRSSTPTDNSALYSNVTVSTVSTTLSPLPSPSASTSNIKSLDASLTGMSTSQYSGAPSSIGSLSAAESGSSHANVIGGAVGGTVAVVLIALILFLVRRHRQKRSEEELHRVSTYETSSFTGTAFTRTGTYTHCCCDHACDHACGHGSVHQRSRPSRSNASYTRAPLLDNTSRSMRSGSVTTTTDRSLSRGRSRRPRRRPQSGATGTSQYSQAFSVDSTPGLPVSHAPPSESYPGAEPSTTDGDDMSTRSTTMPPPSAVTSSGLSTIIRREVAQASWYIPPALQTNAMSLLANVSARRARQPVAIAPVEEVDSGMRLYSGDTLPPRYTAE